MRLTRPVLVLLGTIGALLIPPSPRAAEEDPADAVRLSLGEALSAALEHNLDLSIAKKDPEVAYQDVLFQKAFFDPVFGASAEYSKSKDNPSQVFAGTNTETNQLTAGIGGLLNFGARWSADLVSFKTDTNSNFVFYNPSWTSGLSLTFTLPLLKGLGREASTAALVNSKRSFDISREELRRQATATLRNVEDSYWNLRAAREAQRVAEQTLRLSQDLYDLNKKKVEVGTLAPIEITQAEANVASNVELTIRSKEAVANAEDNLRRLMAVPSDDPMWRHVIVPTEDPVSDARAVNLDDAIANALDARPEILEARAQLENAALSERAARNNARHQLDLKATAAPRGTNFIRTDNFDPDGVPNSGDEFSTPVIGGLGTSLSHVADLDIYQYGLALNYSVPIGNREAKARYATATINREKQEIAVRNTEDIIRVDVRTAARAVESGFERVAAARKNVELQQKKLDAEQKKFDNGMSTSFEVFTFQTDLRNAQLSLIQALLDYNKSLADLERAKGTLLESKGLKLAEGTGR